jgi:hypothetical protein
MMDRDKYLEWAKSRALQLCATNQLDAAINSLASDLSQHPETQDHPNQLDAAINSLASDLSQHPETQDHPYINKMMMLKFSGQLKNSDEVRSFIEGFN